MFDAFIQPAARSGMSSKTLGSSLTYVEHHKPADAPAVADSRPDRQFDGQLNDGWFYDLVMDGWLKLRLFNCSVCLFDSVCSFQLSIMIPEAYVCLENVARKETGEKVQDKLHGMGYKTQCIYANAATFGVPQSRTRLYIVGVLVSKVKLLHDPDQWCVWLKDCDWPGLVEFL